MKCTVYKFHNTFILFSYTENFIFTHTYSITQYDASAQVI